MHTLPQLLEFLDRYTRAAPFPQAPRELYEPCEYILRLGGKRLRPALLMMAYELFRDDVERALPPAWAVELFHNFTLMHDDIMDAAPLRRGYPTVHTKWNTTTGILSGDAMLIYAYRHLATFDEPAAVPQLVRSFSRVATEVCEGQQLDINFEARSDVSIPEYIRMIELKTAVLLGAALEMGAICAGAPASDTEHLYQFGRLAGIAFQIQDDLLDTYGDPAKFGKQVGGDIVQNKKTLLVLKTLEVASPADRLELNRRMQTPTSEPGEKIAAVRAVFDRNNIPDLVSAEQQRFQNEALNHLEKVAVAAEQKAILQKTLKDLLRREH